MLKLRHKNLNIKIESSLQESKHYTLYTLFKVIKNSSKLVPHGRAIHSKTNVLFLKGLVQCLKFDHISYRSITANLQSLQFVTPVIMHAYCYFHHQLVKE